MTGALSFANPQVQRLRRLLGRRGSRSEEGAFVVEGAVLLRQAVAAGWTVEVQYVGAGGEPIECDAPVFRLGPNVLERVASTDTPQPVLAVVRSRRPAMPSAASLVLVADRLGDPGNAGTIIRSAEAAGADAVVLTPGSVDVFNPKVVHASAGSLFRIPVVEAPLRAVGLRLLGTSSHHGTVYTDADLAAPVALVIGNEAHGLPADAQVGGWVTIPSAAGVESLNAAMAATVLLFEAARQRRERRQ
jgi:RNA methyltransferase, TrmH family